MTDNFKHLEELISGAAKADEMGASSLARLLRSQAEKNADYSAFQAHQRALDLAAKQAVLTAQAVEAERLKSDTLPNFTKPAEQPAPAPTEQPGPDEQKNALEAEIRRKLGL